MHILEIPSFFPPYGGLFCLEQSKALAQQGNTVRIIANVNVSARLSTRLWLTAPLHPYDTDMDGIEVTRHEMRAIPFCTKTNIRRWCNGVMRMADTYINRYGRPDILHAHCCAWAGYAAMLVSRRYGIPYVITEHLSHEFHVKEFGRHGADAWQAVLLREAYKEAGLVIPVSQELTDDLAPRFGRKYKWTAVSNVIDTHFYQYRRRKPIANRPYTVCCLANFTPRKGYDTMLEAFAIFLEKAGGNATLLVAGRDTDSQEFDALVGRYGIADHVKTYGYVDKHKILDILYASDCLALATRNEAQGLVLLEAMSTGIPVVTTDRVPQNVRIDGGCRIAPADRADIMADCLYQTMTAAHFDGKAVSDQVAQTASPEFIGKRLTDLLAETASASRLQRHGAAAR